MIREILEARRVAPLEERAIERQIAACNRMFGVGNGLPKPVKIPKNLRKKRRDGTEQEYTYQPSKTNNPDAATGQNEDFYLAHLKKKQAENQALYMRAEKIIDALPDAIKKGIVRHYYCLRWTDEQIGNDMDMPTRTVNKKRNDAIEWLEEKFSACQEIIENTIQV